MDRKLSFSFDCLRFPLIVLVVFIHVFQGEMIVNGELIGAGAYPVHHAVGSLISRYLGSVAVPAFFFISGYLYFRESSLDGKLYLHKSRSRLVTLLIPYLFWNLWVLAFMWGTQVIGEQIGILYTGKMVSHFSFQEIAASFWRRPGENYPLCFQFWYVRDLILMCAGAPIAYFLVKKLGWWPVVLMGLVWLCGWWPDIYPSDMAVFFFLLGASYQLLKGTFIDSFSSVLSKSSLLYPVLLILPFLIGDSYLWKPRILLGVIFILNLAYKYVPERKPAVWTFLASASFFIYAFHEPVQTYLKKMLYLLLHPASEYMMLSIYFLAPITTIAISCAAFIALRKYMPSFCFKIMNGRS